MKECVQPQPRRLTFWISGADTYEASCPELRVAYYSEDLETAKKGLYVAMREKANAIVKSNGNFPFPELAPYAELFVKNRNNIRRSLLEGKDVLASERHK